MPSPASIRAGPIRLLAPGRPHNRCAWARYPQRRTPARLVRSIVVSKPSIGCKKYHNPSRCLTGGPHLVRAGEARRGSQRRRVPWAQSCQPARSRFARLLRHAPRAILGSGGLAVLADQRRMGQPERRAHRCEDRQLVEAQIPRQRAGRRSRTRAAGRGRRGTRRPELPPRPLVHDQAQSPGPGRRRSAACTMGRRLVNDSHAASSPKETSNTTPQVWRCHDQSVAPCVSAVSISESRWASPHSDADVAPSNTSIEYHTLTA